LIVAFVITLSAFGFMLTNHTVSIDEETRLANEGTNWSWATQGRFGIALINLLISPSGDYAPFLWDFLAVVLWFFSGIISCYLLFIKDGILKNKGITILIYCAYCATVPLVAGEILSFSMFNLHVSLAMNMTMIAFALLLDYTENNRISSMIYSSLMLAAAISIYQAMLCVFTVMAAAKALLNLVSKQSGTGLLLIKATAACVVSVLAYALVNALLSLFFWQSSYLSESYLGWLDERGLIYAFAAAVGNVIRYSFGITMRGYTIYGSFAIGVSTLCLIAFCLHRMVHEPKVRAKIGYLMLTGLLVAAPFSMYLLLGTHNTSGRMLLGMPIVQGFGIVMLLNELSGRRTQCAALILAGFLLFLNARNMNMLFYSDSIRYNRDVAIASQIMTDLKNADADYHQKPVIFIGKYAADDIGLVSSGTIGQSFFSWDDGNNRRIIDFLNTLGFAFKQPSPAQCRKAADTASNMAPWPADSSIYIAEDYVAVYLSAPSELWYRVNAP